MLYHYASHDYLAGLHKLVGDLVDGFVDPLLDKARAQGRDAVLADPRWGTRNTSNNWSNNAWPFLKDMQQALSKQLAMRAFGEYQRTYVSEFLRGVDQSSMQWATPAEEQAYEQMAEYLNRRAIDIDNTLQCEHKNRWNDHGFAFRFGAFAQECPRIPRFAVDTGTSVASGDVAPRTGVYVSADDPHAALQFAWNGAHGCRLRNATTFNEVGLAALHSVGREGLWFDEDGMFDFATTSSFAPLFRDDIFFGNEVFRNVAPSAVARKAFVERPNRWHFVEIVEDDAEDTIPIWPGQLRQDDGTERVMGGAACPRAGYYFSPSRIASRRHFAAGETMPLFDSPYGVTIWQRDADQRPA